jgi:hypothetical protein
MCECPLCNWETSTKIRPGDVKFLVNPEAPNGVQSANRSKNQDSTLRDSSYRPSSNSPRIRTPTTGLIP